MKRKSYITPEGDATELDDAWAKQAKRGRPAMLPGERKVRQNFMIDPEIAAKLDEIENKSAFVNEALRKALGA
jgi:hypothetical protein